MAIALRSEHKVLFFGNDGSAADAQPMAAELCGRYLRGRCSLPGLALTTNSSALTAIGNDYSFDAIFARQIEGIGLAGDVAFGISTSGNSANVIRAIEVAHRRKLITIGLTGMEGRCEPPSITASAFRRRRRLGFRRCVFSPGTSSANSSNVRCLVSNEPD